MPPPFQIIHNALRSSSAPAELISRQITACDRVNIEGGFGWTNNDLEQVAYMVKWINRCHDMGRPVIVEETSPPANLASTLKAFEAFCARDDWFAADYVVPDQVPGLLA